jgi:hypothetical protein
MFSLQDLKNLTDLFFGVPILQSKNKIEAIKDLIRVDSLFSIFIEIITISSLV